MKIESRWWPWKVSIFLMGATALSYLDRQALNVVAPLIQQEMALDNAELGFLMSVFLYSYGAMHLFVGFFLDRFNIRLVYAAFVALWSLAQMTTGLARDFVSLCSARVGLGVFEAAGQPGAARIISRILPAKDRSFANGIMMSGGSLGALLAPVIMIALASTVGWRTGFVVLGGAGLVWALGWVLWFRPPAHVLKGPAKRNEEQTEADRWSVILRSPKFWACIAGAAFSIPIIHVVSAWTATYFVQQWSLEVNLRLGGYLFLTGLGRDLGFIAGGGAVTLLARKGFAVGRARKMVLVVSMLLMVGVGAVPWAPGVWVAVLLIMLLEVGRASYGANFLAFNQDIAPGRVGTIAGWMGAVGAFSGGLLVWAIGVISKGSGFTIPFLIIASLAVLGTVPLLVVDWEKHAYGSDHSG